MGHPVVNYDGNYITCYPGSNQTDNGKLNLEFNMARFVTRVTSKNFCIVKPSYEITEIVSGTGSKQLQIGIGQCSINGMDLIMSTEITIDAPETAGTYYLAFKLARGEANNVLGDQAYGVSLTFKGLYLTYFDEKNEKDADALYLAKVIWDGSKFTNIVEDEDKYGRIWAEDILCKIVDPKHPDVSRLTLQEWLYKVPDWYVSKEGDSIFGALEFYAGRNGQKPGITIEADTNTRSYIKLAPFGSTTTSEILLLESNVSSTRLQLGESILIATADNLAITSPDPINLTSQKELNIWGKTNVTIKAGSEGSTPKLLVGNNGMTLTDTTAPSLKYDVKFTNANTLQQVWGKAIWKYNYGDKSVTLASADDAGTVVTSIMNVNPNADFIQSLRAKETIYIGSATSYGGDYTYLKAREWKIADSDNKEKIVIKPENIIITNTQLTSNVSSPNSFIQLKNSDGTISTTVYDDAKITLKNSARAPQILFTDGTSDNDAKIYKSTSDNELHITSKSEIQFDKSIDVNGNVNANKVFNAVYNDLAEFMEKADERELIEAGDVVYFDANGKVTKWNPDINPRAIAGVVSSEETYGFALGGNGLDEMQKVPIALCGRVYLKVGDLKVSAGDMIAVNDQGELFITDTYNIDVLGIATSRTENEKVFIMVK